jgi:hypothetical protein
MVDNISRFVVLSQPVVCRFTTSDTSLHFLLPYDELQNQMDDGSSLDRGDGRDILLGPLRTSWRPPNLACTMLRPARK